MFSFNRPTTLPPDQRPTIPAPMEIILSARVMLQSLIHAGGPKLVFEKWNFEVAESRRKALYAFKDLLVNDLVSCDIVVAFYG